MLDDLHLNLTYWTINSDFLPFLYLSIGYSNFLWLIIYLYLLLDWNARLLARSNLEGRTLNCIFDLKNKVYLLLSFRKSKTVTVDLY